MTSREPLRWFYLDERRSVQGPYSNEKMRQWLPHFPQILEISLSRDLASFKPISAFFSDLDTAFTYDHRSPADNPPPPDPETETSWPELEPRGPPEPSPDSPPDADPPHPPRARAAGHPRRDSRGSDDENQGPPNPSQVIVYNLPPRVTVDFLRELFEHGEGAGRLLESVIKSKVGPTGESYTYAFLTFDTRQASEHAIRELNYTRLDGLPIAIVRCDAATQQARYSGQGKLFVKNLDATIDDSQLHDAFSNFGEVICVRISRNEAGESLGYGFVEFLKREHALQAMEDLKEASINGRAIQISPYVKPPRPGLASAFTNVYVKSETGILPPILRTNDRLAEFMRQFGEVQSAIVRPSTAFGKDGCFGLCNFADHDGAERAVEQLNGQIIDDCPLVCTRCKSNAERREEVQMTTELFRRQNYERYYGRNLYVRGFDEGLTEAQLTDLFAQWGEIESVRIQSAAQGRSKKFGFVCYATAEGAQRCIRESTLLKIRGKQVYVAEAAPADRRRQQNLLAGQARGRGGGPRASGHQPPPGMGGGAVADKDRLRQDILDTQREGARRTELLRSLDEISDEQASVLVRDEALRRRWMNNR